MKKKNKKTGSPNLGQMAKIRPKTRLFDVLTSSRGKIHEHFWAQICAKGTKIGVFCCFFKFGSLVFLEIAYGDSLQQCITSSRGKTHKKDWGGGKFGPKKAKIGLDIWFSAMFSCLVN